MGKPWASREELRAGVGSLHAGGTWFPTRSPILPFFLKPTLVMDTKWPVESDSRCSQSPWPGVEPCQQLCLQPTPSGVSAGPHPPCQLWAVAASDGSGAARADSPAPTLEQRAGVQACRSRDWQITGPYCLPSPPCARLCAQASLSHIVSLTPQRPGQGKTTAHAQRNCDSLRATAQPVSGRVKFEHGAVSGNAVCAIAFPFREF